MIFQVGSNLSIRLVGRPHDLVELLCRHSCTLGCIGAARHHERLPRRRPVQRFGSLFRSVGINPERVGICIATRNDVAPSVAVGVGRSPDRTSVIPVSIESIHRHGDKSVRIRGALGAMTQRDSSKTSSSLVRLLNDVRTEHQTRENYNECNGRPTDAQHSVNS